MAIKEPITSETIDRKVALRRLIHSGIRMTFWSEDPLSVHLVAHSIDKVAGDLLKHHKVDDPISFEERIAPKHRREFFNLFRKSYNFLKHAETDPEATIDTTTLCTTNDLLLLHNAERYKHLYKQNTFHMRTFYGFVIAQKPKVLNWHELPGGDEALKNLESFRHITRSDFIEQLKEHCTNSGEFLKERSEDLEFLREVNHVRLSGEPGPPRFRIPIVR